MVKIFLKKLLPNKIFIWLKTLRLFLIVFQNYFYDALRFAKYTTSFMPPNTKEQLEARIIAVYHVIEKGLSLKEPRVGYGNDYIKYLLNLLNKFIAQGYNQNSFAFLTAVSVLNEYIRFHETRKYNMNDLKKKVLELSKFDISLLGGIIKFDKQKMLDSSKQDFYNFAMNRFSVRNFSDEKVDIELVYEAIKIAQKTPSVCNRQSAKVYIIQEEHLKQAVLNIQTGNRGFGHLSKVLLIITSDLQTFEGIQERNQSFVDGGMFAMSVLYGLHYVGLAACALSWSVTKREDLELRKTVRIKLSENIVLIIAVGHYPNEFIVAKSSRKPLEQIISEY